VAAGDRTLHGSGVAVVGVGRVWRAGGGADEHADRGGHGGLLPPDDPCGGGRQWDVHRDDDPVRLVLPRP